MERFCFPEELFALVEEQKGIPERLFAVPEQKFSVREQLFCLRERLFAAPEEFFSLTRKKGSRPGAASCLWRKEWTPQAMAGSTLRRVLAQRLDSSRRAASRPCWRPETLSRA